MARGEGSLFWNQRLKSSTQMMLQNRIPETYLPLLTNVTPINAVKQRAHRMSSGHPPPSDFTHPGNSSQTNCPTEAPPVHVSHSNSSVFKAETPDTTRPKRPVRHLPQTLAGAGHRAAHGSDSHLPQVQGTRRSDVKGTDGSGQAPVTNSVPSGRWNRNPLTFSPLPSLSRSLD